MKIFYISFGVLSLCCLGSCQRSSQEVVKTSYYHQYGPAVKAAEWKEQGSTGEVSELLSNGVEVRRAYHDGVLQGQTTWSFPYSKVVERFEEYEGGVQVGFGENYSLGAPKWQVDLAPAGKKMFRAWYEDGAPRVVEELQNDLVVEGQYFTDSGELESVVKEGNGLRIERSERGVLLFRDRIVEKEPVVKETFYPNGLVKEVTSYRSLKKDGLSKSFDDAGRPEVVQWWVQGDLSGVSTYFKDGLKVSQVPFQHGKKEGVEVCFDPDTGALIEEISWKNDRQHGLHRLYTSTGVIEEWYVDGKKATKDEFNKTAK